MKSYFLIADAYLEIKYKIPILHKELMDFEVKDFTCDTSDLISIELINNSIPQYPDNVIIKSDYISINEDDQYFYAQYNHTSNVLGYILAKHEKKAKIYINDVADDKDIDLKYSIRDCFIFYLQKLDKVVIHSASIIYKEKGWLFSALSGTGKTTHVNMWKESKFPVEDFNGDLAACYFDKNGIAVAASMPWCGSSGIYTNKVIPIGGVIFLKQAKANNIKSLRLVDGIINLTARCITPAWNKELLLLNLDVTKKMATEIVLAELLCKPDKEAAEVAKRYIDSKICS